jgi:MFS family permease
MLFDGMDMSIYVLTLYPSLSELLHTTSHQTVGFYGSAILAVFLFGWTFGAILFGTMADYIGRTKTLIVTVIFYAVFTGLCATSHSWQELAFYRFFVGCGIGGEISIGGVMLAEYWSGNARFHATGLLQSAFNFGCIVLAILGILTGHLGWRALYVAGIAPALLAIYIRAKLKDPPDVKAVREHRLALRKKQIKSIDESESKYLRLTLFDLFRGNNLQKAAIVIILAATTMTGQYAAVSWVPAWINQLTGTTAIVERSVGTIVLNIGAIIGHLTAGFIIIALGRAKSFRFAFLFALCSCMGMFLTTKTWGAPLLIWALIAGYFVMAPYTYLFIYVPELFETHLRATAFSFSIQAGRVIAGILALVSGQLIASFDGSYAIAGASISSVYVIGFIASFFLPKTSGHVQTEIISSESPTLTSSTN